MTIGQLIMQFNSFADFSQNVLRNIDINMQLRELMMPLPRNTHITFYMQKSNKKPQPFNKDLQSTAGTSLALRLLCSWLNAGMCWRMCC